MMTMVQDSKRHWRKRGKFLSDRGKVVLLALLTGGLFWYCIVVWVANALAHKPVAY